MLFRKKSWLRTSCFIVLLYLPGTAAIAQTAGKIPREVIDHTAAHGTALVLVGLDMPWQMESGLSEDQVRTQRETIALVQKDSSGQKAIDRLGAFLLAFDLNARGPVMKQNARGDFIYFLTAGA